MELQYPADVAEARVREGRNISNLERWSSVAVGSALVLSGLSRRHGAGWLMTGLGALLVGRGLSGRCPVYETLGINTADTSRDTRRALGGRGGINVEESVTIDRPIEEVYRFWRKLENLPSFMRHLESVEPVTETLSRWRAKGPADTHAEWNAEIINEVANQVIGWRSLEGSDVVSAGSVNFHVTDRGHGTHVRVRLQYNPPGGKVGAAAAKLMGQDPATEIREDLQNFKQMLETGNETGNSFLGDDGRSLE